MEKRKVRFQHDAQSALLWLMSNRTERLYDEFGTSVIHSNHGNIIEMCSVYCFDNEDGLPDWDDDYEHLSYEDFIKIFNEHTLESI